jgi:hypothetical protein
LERIAKAGRLLHYLEFYTLRWKPPDEIKELREVGGNVGLAIDNALLLQTYAKTRMLDGLDAPRDRICDLLKDRLDPVSWKIALERLGKHFMPGDREGMFYVASAMPHDSWYRRELLRCVRRLADPASHLPWVRRDFGEPSDEPVDSD